jgi:hypothetical protein
MTSTIWKRVKHSTEAIFWVDEEETWFLRLCKDFCNLVYILPVGVMATTIRDAECTDQLLGVAVIFAVLLGVLIRIRRWKFLYHGHEARNVCHSTEYPEEKQEAT